MIKKIVEIQYFAQYITKLKSLTGYDYVDHKDFYRISRTIKDYLLIHININPERRRIKIFIIPLKNGKETVLTADFHFQVDLFGVNEDHDLEFWGFYSKQDAKYMNRIYSITKEAILNRDELYDKEKFERITKKYMFL